MNAFERNAPTDFVHSEDEAASILGVHKATLRRLVDRGEGPAKIRLTTRRVGYLNSSLTEFLARRQALTA